MQTEGMRARKIILANLLLLVFGSFPGCGAESAPPGAVADGGVPGTGGWSGSGGTFAPDQTMGGADVPDAFGGLGGEGMPNDSAVADVTTDSEETAPREDAATETSAESTDSSAESSDGPLTGPINNCPATVTSGASCATPDQLCAAAGGSACICLQHTWFCS